MHNKKTNYVKAFTTVIRRFFRARNIIIVSEHKVGHVPLSGLMQVLLVVGILGFFSGASYITGSYVAARSSLKEKDEKIVTSSLEKTHIGAEMDILKRDLLKLSQNGKELSAYSKFIIDEYAGDSTHDDHVAINATALSNENLFGQNNEKLNDRIAYLEGRMNEIRDENDHLVMAIRERTNKKIDYFDDIIAMTGLNADRLEHMAKSGTGKLTIDNSAASSLDPSGEDDSAKKDSDDTIKDDVAKKDFRVHGENQGGPFIPYDTTSFNDSDRELLSNVDRLVLLHDIVEQLPIRMPIADAQTTGPFGKRVDPLNGRWAIHPGMDIAGPIGSHIYSASSGKVISAGRKIAYGNMIDIDHGFGIVTRYAHLSKILVHEGQVVTKGQQIGVQGSTGRSTGPHLHFEVRINDRPVNPAKFLHAGEYVLEN